MFEECLLSVGVERVANETRLEENTEKAQSPLIIQQICDKMFSESLRELNAAA